jgi:hypothetical protein
MTKRRFMLLVSLAALAFAPTSSEAQNSALTPEVAKKIETAVTENGRDHTINAVYATALGLTANLDWPDRQLLMNGTDGMVHAFIISRGDDKDFVLYVHLPDGSSVDTFHTRRDGTLVKAITFNIATKEITLPDVGEAQKKLDDEIGFWTRSADKLLLISHN